jgi:hypothetical protein
VIEQQKIANGDQRGALNAANKYMFQSIKNLQESKQTEAVK